MGRMEEILLVVLVGLVVFGAGRLPEIGKNLGKGIQEFKKALSGKDDEDKKDS
jgi:sec-independent protein translocase protein TatA